MSDVLTQPSPQEAEPEVLTTAPAASASADVTAPETAHAPDVTEQVTDPSAQTSPLSGAEAGAGAGWDLDTELAKATTPQQYDELLKRIEAQPAAAEPPSPAEPRTPVPAAEALPAGNEGAGKAKDPDGKLPHITVRPTDEVQIKALQILRDREKQGKPVSLSEAERLAKVVMGLEEAAPAASTPPATTPPPATVGAPGDLQTLETKIAELQKERAEANAGFEAERSEELTQAIDALKEERLLLKLQQQQAALNEQKSFEIAQQAAVQKWGEDVNNPDSALSMVASGIQARLIAANDPQAYDPSHIYAQAAQKLNHPARGTAARSEASPLAPPPSAPHVSKSQPAARPPAAAILASGSAGTNSTPAAALNLDAIKTPHDYNQLVERLIKG